MKKYWQWIVIAIVVAVIGLVAYNNKGYFIEKPFKIVALYKESYVVNRTQVPFLDTIVHLGLKELHIPKTLVLIKTLDPSLLEAESGLEIKAYVEEHSGSYLIYIRPMGREESIKILSHEMIHIAQYHLGEIRLTDKGVIWKKTMLYPTQTPYEQRPWEQQAFALQRELYDKIAKQLY
jgi:hypothetical protein